MIFTMSCWAMSGWTLVMYMRKGSMVSSTMVLTTLFLGRWCSLMVWNCSSRASLPPMLFMKLKVMPWTLAREDKAALM